MLTKKQKKIFDYIQKYSQKNNYSPSHEEMRKHFKLASVSTINHYMKILQKKGYIKHEKNAARAVEIGKQAKVVSIPFRGYIAAGQPIEAVEEYETITVPKTMVSSSGQHFALGVKGDSMIDEGIFDGDTVIVRKQNTVENGETAVALINGNEVTLKKIFREKNRIRLQPANPKLKPLYVKAVIIQGKVISAIRNVERQEVEGSDFQPDIVFYLSAQAIVLQAYENPIQTYEINVIGTLKLFEACRKCDSIKAIINITSDKCYDNKEWVFRYREKMRLEGTIHTVHQRHVLRY